jgi:hypothetical protein
MTIRYRAKENQREKRLTMVVILSGVILLIIGFCVFLAFFGTEYMIDKSLDDPDVLVSVGIVGDDVIVTVYEGRRIDELVMLSVEIEGVTLPSSMTTMPAPTNGVGKITFKGACAGVTGKRDVAVRGIFSDGGTRMLKLYTVTFT